MESLVKYNFSIFTEDCFEWKRLFSKEIKKPEREETGEQIINRIDIALPVNEWRLR